MQFGKYRLIEKIGQGGMAEVFYAHIVGRQGFTKEVALKRVLPHLCEDPDFVESFVDEARVGGLLNHHHIVQTLDFGAENGIYYIAMEYVHGLTLRALMTYHKRRHIEIPPPIVLDLALQLCDGLRYAHHAEDENGNPINMVHRDLKPTNILLSSHGVIKIADFGIARAETNSRRTALGGILKGTAQYMSPEQAFGELHLDRRSDIFSLGSIIYELVTLTPLFYDRKSSVQTLRNVQDAVVEAPLARMVDRIPYSRQLYPILRHVLAREPANRPSDISEIIPPLRKIQMSFETMVDIQDWMEGIMRDMGQTVRGRRPGSKLNVPVQPPTPRIEGAVRLHDRPAQAPDDGRLKGQSAPTVAEPLPPELVPDPDEATPVVRLRDIPGQPRLRDAPEPTASDASGDISVTLPVQHQASPEGYADETRNSLPVLDSPTREDLVERPVGSTDGSLPPKGRDRIEPTQTVPNSQDLASSPLPFGAGALNEEALGELPLAADSGFLPEPDSQPPQDGYNEMSVPEGEPAAPSHVAPSNGNPPGSAGHTAVADPHDEFLDKTPAWIEGTTGAGSASPGTARLQEQRERSEKEEQPPPELAKIPPARPGMTRRLLPIVATAVVVSAVILILAAVFLHPGPNGPVEGAVRVTIDTVPGGAEVVFSDKRLQSGRTPLARELPRPVDCIEVAIRHDGYNEIHRCLPVGNDGFVEPVQLEPAPRAAGVILRYPLDVEGLEIYVDEWEVDLRQRISRPGNQASVRTYVSPTTHRVRVTTQSCGEIESDFDFRHTNIYKFIKIVRSSKAPCKIAFSRDD